MVINSSFLRSPFGTCKYKVFYCEKPHNLFKPDTYSINKTFEKIGGRCYSGHVVTPNPTTERGCIHMSVIVSLLVSIVAGAVAKHGKNVANKGKTAILKEEHTKEVIDVHTIGKIDREIYKCITEDIVTDEVVITDNQIRHILDRHPEAYEKVMGYISDTIKSPDYIIADKHPFTGLVVKKIYRNNEYLQVVLRVCTSGDEKGYKNSVISCWNISERRLQNYLRNKKILYKKE